ncbi:hypothetical protein CRUP_032913 [Coryphaenoides rupestris]|nr:hypothetical protein CRUP_032913 [Coryphaenoides rupestris]
MHVAEVVSAAVAQGRSWGFCRAHRAPLHGHRLLPGVVLPASVAANTNTTRRSSVLSCMGGVKVLITGPWQEVTSSYSCLFDQISVPASLIQPGVLRCYCPAHDTGLVTLQVAITSQIISNSVVFEYKARALPSLPSSQHDWLSLDECPSWSAWSRWRGGWQRWPASSRAAAPLVVVAVAAAAAAVGAAAVEVEVGAGPEAGLGPAGQEVVVVAAEEEGCVSGSGQASSSFESRVVVVCEKMMSRACWAKSKHLIHSKTFRGMTLLHLAAGQGYATLIQTLIKWRNKHSDSIDLELEVDPLNVDHFSCTPLWDRRALAIPDSLGRLPLSIARSRGHTKLAECLERLQRGEDPAAMAATPPSLATPPTTTTAARMSFSPTADADAAAAADSWMVSWASEGVVASGGNKPVTTTTTRSSSSSSSSSISSSSNANPNLDLRRPRSEPSSLLTAAAERPGVTSRQRQETQSPAPSCYQAPGPTRPSVAWTSTQLHHPTRLSSSPKEPGSLSEGLSSDRGLSVGVGGGAASTRWTSGRERGRGSGVGGGGASGGLGKEKLASRLRQREQQQQQQQQQLGMMAMADPDMVDTAELLSYREDLVNQDCLTQMDDLQVNMMSLAEHIIDATPERIKREMFAAGDSVPLDTTGVSSTMSWLANYLGDVEQLPSIIHLRSLYNEPLPPSSNAALSPGGGGGGGPGSSPPGRGEDGPLLPEPRPGLPSPADWSDFINASNSKVERDLAQLTLSDPEQRELYEAARLVQTAFRKYKCPVSLQAVCVCAVCVLCVCVVCCVGGGGGGCLTLGSGGTRAAQHDPPPDPLTLSATSCPQGRPLREQQEYALYKKMTQAAILIQSKFRSYHEQKKFQQSRRAAVLIQQYYRSYRRLGRPRTHRHAAAALLQQQHKLR